MSARKLVTLILVVLSAAANAQWYDANTREKISDNDWRKKSGPMGAMLALTGEAATFLKEWRETPQDRAPRLSETDKVTRGHAISAFVFFSGCAAEGEPCAATVDFTVLSPDGKVYGEHKGIPAWSRPAPRPDLVLLSDAYLKAVIEPNDALGTYTVKAEVRVPGSNIAPILLQKKFEVAP